MIEEWRPVVGLEGLYEVSNLGRVRSLPRVITQETGRLTTVRGRIRKLCYHKGYATFSHAGKTRGVHRMVMQSFCGPAPHRMEVRHLDGNPRNCRLDNLCYGTHHQNVLDMLDHGTARCGEKSCTAKLTEAQVRRIRTTPAGLSNAVLAAEFGVSRRQIGNIRNGLKWRHLLVAPAPESRVET